jgi:hypothetical protein
MLRRHLRVAQAFCAPALVLALAGLAPRGAKAQQDWPALPPVELISFQDSIAGAADANITPIVPEGETWIAPSAAGSQTENNLPLSEDSYWIEPRGDGPIYFEDCPPDAWAWQVLPNGLIYHSYLAGVHEPRLSVVMFDERDGRSLWDATLGARVGILRYGDNNPFRPQGWQLDFEGAAIMRFTFDRARDFETADYRAGVPITYGVGDWQYKFGYYHLSSHMGDEFAIRNPGALADRINYVRDALVLGASYFPHPVWRVYAEAAYALKIDGGAEPWEFQFGTELSRPGPTGRRGTPFAALNAHLREEHDFGGDVTTQVGWLWRGRNNQTMRLGLHYFNGKSSQYQTFDDSEEQIGFGVWYDF